MCLVGFIRWGFVLRGMGVCLVILGLIVSFALEGEGFGGGGVEG